MFKNEADFEETVARLKIDDKPNPAHRESLRREMLSAYNNKSRISQRFITLVDIFRRTIMRSTVTKLATAAIIIIAALILMDQPGGSMDGTTVALAEVKEAVEKMSWMHAVNREYYKGKERIKQHWQHFPSKKIIEVTSGYISYWDYGVERKLYFYDPSEETLTITDVPDGGFYGSDSVYGLVSAFVQYNVEDGASVKKYFDKHDGRNVQVYEIEKIRRDEGMSVGKKTVSKIKYRIMVDVKSRLMVAAGNELLDKNDEVIKYTKVEIDYPETGPSDIYALGVPRKAEIIDKTEIALAKEKDESKLVALDIQLPRPMFVGTPQDTKVPNLEKPLGHARPPFLAPVGTTNVALGKPVSSSDKEPIIGEIDYITDGDKEAADGSYVELGPMLQHVTIDLEAEHRIYAVVVWHYHKQARVYFDTIVQIADDPDFTTNVRTVFNNDIDNSAGFGIGKDKHYSETNEGKLIDTKGITGRYVRFYSAGNTSNDLNHYIEVEVYGIPVQ